MSPSQSTHESEGSQIGNGSILVVNMRGLVNTRTQVRKTLEQLHLMRRFNSTIVPDTASYRGMLGTAKEHVAWCRIDAATTEKLLRSRAERSDGIKFKESDLKKFNNTFASFVELARAVEAGQFSLHRTVGMRSFFRLKPPRGGFRRSSRRQYGQGGILGPNKELLKFLESMI